MQRVFDAIGPRTEYSVNLLDGTWESLHMVKAAISTSGLGEHVGELHEKG